MPAAYSYVLTLQPHKLLFMVTKIAQDTIYIFTGTDSKLEEKFSF